MVNKIIILGSGGGGRTAASIIESWYPEQNQPKPVIEFLDDADRRQHVNGYPVVGPVAMAFDDLNWPEGTAFVVAFGSMCLPARKRVFLQLQAKGRLIINAIHSRAIIDHFASIGVGNIIAANCVIHPNAKIGCNCFLCVATTIDHDNEVGDNVYFSPGVHLAGGVVVEDNVFIGTGAVVLPEVHIGKGAIIGAGAVVIQNVAAESTVVGIPARTIKKKEDKQP